MTARFALTMGALLALVAVALGAFGAHALKGRLEPDMATVWQTAAQYHGWHALALVAAGLLLLHRPDAGAIAAAAWLFAAGVVLFSGSLYLLALTGARGWARSRRSADSRSSPAGRRSRGVRGGPSSAERRGIGGKASA